MNTLSGLRYWRLRARYSQRDLAAELKVAPQTVSDWETGRARPRFKHVRRLMQLLEVPSLDELFSEAVPSAKKEASA